GCVGVAGRGVPAAITRATANARMPRGYTLRLWIAFAVLIVEVNLSYRDDLDAAQARAEAAERRAALLQKQLDAQKPDPSAAPEVPIPERYTVSRHGDELSISWRWFKPGQHLFLLFFVIAWDAFLVNWYFGAGPGSGDIFFYVFPIAHVAAGIGLTYAVLTGFLNRTYVT